ncbi:MAG: RIP metalloprotease RseP [Parcubacteria group bacterium SW_6_46_9]|nr:MAG: RIP metalloprotease RseP [Parcubacteria group bacterium SW_6_46_9]
MAKIFGEDLENIDEDHPDKDRSFAEQSTGSQVAVLVAGVVMNMILAYLLLSLAFMTGKAVVDEEGTKNLTDRRVVITQVLPDSPAETAGLNPGSRINEITSGQTVLSGSEITLDGIQQLVNQATSAPVTVSTQNGSDQMKATVTPTSTESGDRQIGIAMAQVGTQTLGPLGALKEGAVATYNLTHQTVVGFYNLIGQALTGSGGLSQVAGPVGIADLVGDAADRGAAPLFSFVALISINLAILNLLPFPALDGGRIVLSLIEYTRGKPLPPKFAKWANGIGLALLLLLMLVVTYQDILRLL